MSEKRKEFGFARTEDCACASCQLNCEHLSGYLVPQDLKRMAEACGYSSVIDFANHHLSASPGALVSKDGVVFHIRTLVPRRDSSGRCTFLDADQRCTIHDVSPYGCAFFGHLGVAESDRRSSRGLAEIWDEWMKQGLYAAVWNWLAQRGLLACDPIEARKELATKNGRESW